MCGSVAGTPFGLNFPSVKLSLFIPSPRRQFSVQALSQAGSVGVCNGHLEAAQRGLLQIQLQGIQVTTANHPPVVLAELVSKAGLRTRGGILVHNVGPQATVCRAESCTAMEGAGKRAE